MDYNDFINKLNIPESCELNKNVYKSLFYDKSDMKYADKQVFTKDIEKISWLYTLKEDTIPISAYIDEEQDYSEIAIIEVDLRKKNRIERIADIMQRTIPYPLMIIFKFENDILINLAYKKINKADHEKATYNQLIQTDWIDLEDLNEQEETLIDNLDFQDLSYFNFYQFYSDLVERIIAYKKSKYTGQYKLDNNRNSEDVLRLLSKIENNEDKIKSLKRKIKKENQFNKKMDLNINIKKLKNKNNQLIKTLEED